MNQGVTNSARRGVRALWASAAGGALALACASPALADVAEPDLSFGDAGLAAVAFGADASADAAAIAPDGDIVVVGSVQGSDGIVHFAIARLNPDGTPDEGFSSDGRLTLNLADGGATGVAVRADGDIVVAGNAGNEVAVVELEPDGTLDDGFAGNGVRVFGYGDADEGSASDLTIDGSGNVVVAGFGPSERLDGGQDAALARLTPTGELDPTFDGNGKVTAGLVDIGSGGPSNEGASALEIIPGGDIAIAGSVSITPDVGGFYGQIAVDGAVETMRAIVSGRDYGATDLAVLSSGEPLVVGKYVQHAGEFGDALAWLMGADGSVLDSWDVSPPAPEPSAPRALAVAALANGSAIGSTGSPASLFLLDPDAEDASTERIPFAAQDLQVVPDGKVIGIGSTAGDGGQSDFIVGRFMPPTEPPPQTKITDGPRGTIHHQDVRFRFRSIPSGATFLCRLDHYAWHECDSPYRLGPLTHDRHRFRVRAISETGMRDPTPAKRDFTIK